VAGHTSAIVAPTPPLKLPRILSAFDETALKSGEIEDPGGPNCDHDTVSFAFRSEGLLTKAPNAAELAIKKQPIAERVERVNRIRVLQQETDHAKIDGGARTA
jgi:hypothetical protein